MKNFALASAATAVAVLLTAAPLSAGTLKITYQSGPYTIGNGNNTVTLDSPILSLSFANAVDYALLSNPTAGPNFGTADLVAVEWTRIENLGGPVSTNNPGPLLSQALFDTLTYKFSDKTVAFQPVTGSFLPVPGTEPAIGFALSSSTSFINGPMILLQRWQSGNFISPRGNWDEDTFNDALPWRMGQSSLEWNPSATSFATDPTDDDNGDTGGTTSPVPLPAGLPLLLAGLGVFGLVRRRQR